MREAGHSRRATGPLNLYQPFLDRSLSLARQGGRVGLVLPWGLAADDGARRLRDGCSAVGSRHTRRAWTTRVVLFPIHRGLRFLVLTTTAGGPTHEIRGRFGLKTAAELDALPARVDVADGDPFPIRLTPRLIRSVGGPAGRFPDIRHADDLRATRSVDGAVPAARPRGRMDRLIRPRAERDGSTAHSSVGRVCR